MATATRGFFGTSSVQGNACSVCVRRRRGGHAALLRGSLWCPLSSVGTSLAAAIGGLCPRGSHREVAARSSQLAMLLPELWLPLANARSPSRLPAMSTAGRSSRSSSRRDLLPHGPRAAWCGDEQQLPRAQGVCPQGGDC